MRISRRQILSLASFAFAAPALARRAAADTPAAGWPKGRMIRAIVPFNAGSTVDIIGRIVMEPLSQRLGQSIVVENRGGAGGTIGAMQVARADPDGYTLLINAANHTVAPAAYKAVGYDAANDFTAIACFGIVPNVLVISPSKGIRTLEQFVAQAKKGEMSFASAGIGSAAHWAAERFRLSVGFRATHIPFRGGMEALTEVMTGRVDFDFSGISAAMPLIREGRLLPLVVTSAQRSPALPDVITSIEAGYKGSEYNFWNGLLGPAKLPRTIVDRMHAQVMAVLAMTAVQKKLDIQGVQATPISPRAFDAQIRDEIALNLKVAKDVGLALN